MNHFQSTGANSHIECVPCEFLPPSQRVVAQRQCKLNTDKYVALITWLIKVAKHPGYVNFISPDEYYDPIMLDQEATKQNTDES